MHHPRLMVLDCTLSATSGRIFVAAVKRLLPPAVHLVVHAPTRDAGSSWLDDFLRAPPAGLLISGSAASVVGGPAWVEPLAADLRRTATVPTPTLGICFGHQLLAHAWGGKLRCPATPSQVRGIRRVELQTLDQPLLGGQKSFDAAFSHRDQVTEPPPGWHILAASDYSPIQALAAPDLPLVGVQWHPEADRAMILDNPEPDPHHPWNQLLDSDLRNLGGRLVLTRFLSALAPPHRSYP